MKIEISIHAFLVQVCKVNCRWLDLRISGIDDDEAADDFISDFNWGSFKDILNKIPGIHDVNFDLMIRNIPVDRQQEPFRQFWDSFTFARDASVVQDFLGNILQTVSDGVIGLQLRRSEYVDFETLMQIYHSDCTILEEFKDPKYNTFTLVEE